MTNQERLQANNAKIEAIQETLKNKVVTSGEIELTENNTTYDVSKYASARTNIEVPDLSETTATAEDVVSGKVFYNASGEKVAGSYVDALQRKINFDNSLNYLFVGATSTAEIESILRSVDTSNLKSVEYMFQNAKFETAPMFDTSNVISFYSMFFNNGSDNVLKNIPSYDTSKGEDFKQMFYNRKGLTDAPLLDFSSADSVSSMFGGCASLKNIPEYKIGNIRDVSYMFSNCKAVTTLPIFDMSNCSEIGGFANGCTSLTELHLKNTQAGWNFSGIVSGCSSLVTIETLDLGHAEYISTMFSGCTNLTNLTLKNIKKTIQIGSGTSYGHLLTLESLLNTIKELWINTSGTKTLTMGTANTAKLANVYVKLIPITDEMRAEDEYIDNKAPFVVCESTDEGAMLITEYVTNVKKWQLA